MPTINSFPIQTADISAVADQIKAALNVDMPYSNIAYVADPLSTITDDPMIGNPYKPFATIREALDAYEPYSFQKHIVLLNEISPASFIYDVSAADNSVGDIIIETSFGFGSILIELPTNIDEDFSLTLYNSNTLYIDYVKSGPFISSGTYSQKLSLNGFRGFVVGGTAYFHNNIIWNFRNVDDIYIDMFGSTVSEDSAIKIHADKCGNIEYGSFILIKTPGESGGSIIPGFSDVQINILHCAFNFIYATNPLETTGQIYSANSYLSGYEFFTLNNLGGNSDVGFPLPPYI